MGDLTPHFNWSEFNTRNKPLPAHVKANIQKLANEMEKVRSKLGGHPITITSGYRDPQHNKEIGGAPNSLHTQGMAADFTVKGLLPRAVQKALKDWKGGLGCYATWTHLDIGPRRRW